MSQKSKLKAFSLLTALIFLSTGCDSQDDGWVDLLEDGLTAWEDSSGWAMAKSVSVNPENASQLSVEESGKTIAFVDRKKSAAYLLSRELHGDVEAVVEFMVPEGSNSGIYFMGRYEVQIFDSFGKKRVRFSDCGAIYRRIGEFSDEGHPPLLNAATAPGSWQRFEVVFRAPRFNKEGQKIENAKFLKVSLNGKLVQENVEVTGPTQSAMDEFGPEVALGPLRIQGDHGAVAYRTIKIRHLQ